MLSPRKTSLHASPFSRLSASSDSCIASQSSLANHSFSCGAGTVGSSSPIAAAPYSSSGSNSREGGLGSSGSV